MKMSIKLFRHWDWEHDEGIGIINGDMPRPKQYAAAFFDWTGRLYRVNVHQHDGDLFVYDYFCDEMGRISQKRSLSESGDVVLIVDLERDGDGTIVRETAWYPHNGEVQSIKRTSSGIVREPKSSRPHN